MSPCAGGGSETGLGQALITPRLLLHLLPQAQLPSQQRSEHSWRCRAVSPAEGSDPAQDCSSGSKQSREHGSKAVSRAGMAPARGAGRRGVNADWLLTSALAPGMADLSSPGGEGRAGAEPGPCSGTMGKNKPGGSDNPSPGPAQAALAGVCPCCASNA